eukprot:scaffold95368_cov28-Tisochrysis_lutea.AAC.7
MPQGRHAGARCPRPQPRPPFVARGRVHPRRSGAPSASAQTPLAALALDAMRVVPAGPHL